MKKTLMKKRLIPLLLIGCLALLAALAGCDGEQDPKGPDLKIELKHEGTDLVIYGIPAGQEDMIILSWSQQYPMNEYPGNPAYPDELVLSVSREYEDIEWYIDGKAYLDTTPTQNIITIYAKDYVLKKNHTITFIGTKNGSRYSESVQFTVIK